MANITSCIERIESFEDKLGISLDALRAVVSDEGDCSGEYRLQITGELMSTSGGELECPLSLVYAVYDDSGSIIDTNDRYFNDDDFMGFEIFDFTTYLESNNIQKIRLFPKKS